jgi:endonuclease/exonuclease/phosphatase family metal-dependent hydrolase
MFRSTQAIVIGILAAAMCGCSYVGPSNSDAHNALSVFSEPTVSPIDDGRLGILTYNMFHRDKSAELNVLAQHLRTMPEGAPDFILCQEVLFQRYRSDGHDSTADVLGEVMGYYTNGTKRKSDREGLAILSRYPFDYYEARHLKARTLAILLGFRRVSTMGEFIVPDVGRVRVVNVHFAHWGFEKHVRMKQLRETLAWIADRQRAVPAQITFLGGDFNAKPDSSEIAMLQDPEATGPLKYTSFNSNEPTKSGVRRSRPHKRIDYIFVAGPSCALISEQVLAPNGLEGPNGTVWLSDHRPVLHHYAVGSERMASAPAP